MIILNYLIISTKQCTEAPAKQGMTSKLHLSLNLIRLSYSYFCNYFSSFEEGN